MASMVTVQPMMRMKQLPGMPAIGLGVWKAPADVTEQVVYDALTIGYRHLDCACDYGNEQAVGAALRRAFADGLCKREDLWITSKLWNTYHKYEHVQPACQKTLDDLGLDYLDLYLIHFPISLEYVPFDTCYPPEWTDKPGNSGYMRLADVPYQETWRAMEELHALGKAKHIGVSNVSAQLFMDVCKYAKVRPACNQIENHLYLQQPKLVELCQEMGAAVVAYSPLGAVSYVGIGLGDASENVLQDPALTKVAAVKGCSPAQVCLAFQLQRGLAVIPKSVKPERLRENLESANVSLSEAEMGALAALERHRRFNDPGVFAKGWGEPGSMIAKIGYPIH